MSTEPSVTVNNYGLTLMNLDKFKLINVKEQSSTLDYTQYLKKGNKSSEYITDTLEGKTEEQLAYYFTKAISKVVLHLSSNVIDMYTDNDKLLYSMKITQTDHYLSYMAYIRTILNNTFDAIQYDCLNQTFTFLPNKNVMYSFKSLYEKIMHGMNSHQANIPYRDINIAYPVVVPINLKPHRIYQLKLVVKRYDIFNQMLIDDTYDTYYLDKQILLNVVNTANDNTVQLDYVFDLAQYLTTSLDKAIRYSYIVELEVKDCSDKQLSTVAYSADNYYIYLKNIPAVTRKSLTKIFFDNVLLDIKYRFRQNPVSSILKTLFALILGYIKLPISMLVILIYFLKCYHKKILSNLQGLRDVRKNLTQSYAVVSESSTQIHSLTECPNDNVTSSIDDTNTTQAIDTNIETAVNISTLTNFILNSKTRRCDYLVGLVTECHNLYKESLLYKDAGLANFNRILKAYTKNMLYLNEVYIKQYKLLNSDLENKIIESIESLQDFMIGETSKMKALNKQFDSISRSYLYDKLTRLSNEVDAYKEI